MFGIFWGAWGAVLPAVQASARVSDARLGLALLLVEAGALASMRRTGRFADRRGPAATAVVMAAFAVTAVLPAFAGSLPMLAVSLALLGAASGAVGVAVNAEGVRTETTTGRRVLHLGHAAFSGAVVLASLAAGALRGVGAGALPILAGVAILLAGVAVALRAPATPIAPAEPAAAGRRWAATPRWLLLLGVLCALAYWTENAWQSWSAIHLERLGATAGVGALGPALFASAAVAGRLAGQRLTGRVGDRWLIAGGAVVAALGTALAALAPGPGLALPGIVLAGAGTSVCAPTIFSLAGAAAGPSSRGAAVSAVTTLGYLGFLVGPAAVGGLSGLAGLPVALLATAGLALLLAVLAVTVRLPARPPVDISIME